MKKTLLGFGLTALTILASCNDGQKKTVPGMVSNDKEQPTTSGCVVEVPCNEPELEVSGHRSTRKFYDFCDSTVTITWNDVSYSTYYIHNHETRPIEQLRGTERKEMEAAYTKYQMALKQ